MRPSSFRQLRPHHGAPTVCGARPGHRPARRVVQSAACRPPHDQRDRAQAGLGLDKVWWIVSPGNPLKKRSDTAPLAERMALCRADAQEIPTSSSRTSRRTCRRPTRPRRWRSSRARSPLVRFVWIMGADNLATFDRWQHWREIFAMVPVVVVDRPGWRMKALASKAARTFAAARVPEAEARGLALQADARLDVPHGPPVLGVLDGDAQQGAARRQRSVAKKTQSAGGTLGSASQSPPRPVAQISAAAERRVRWQGLESVGVERLSSELRISPQARFARSERGRPLSTHRTSARAQPYGFDDERTFSTICQPHLRVLAGARLRPNSCPRTTRKPSSVTSRPGSTTPRPRRWWRSTSGGNLPSATTW